MTATFSIEKGEMGGKSSHSKVSRPGRTRLHICIHVGMWRSGACLCPGIDESAWVPDGSPLAVAARARRRVGARGGEVTVSGGRKAALELGVGLSLSAAGGWRSE